MQKKTDIIYRLQYDRSLRKALRKDAKSVCDELGLGIDAKSKIKILTNTKAITYIVLPNEQVDLRELEKIQAAKPHVATASTAGTAGTLSTFPATTLSSISSAGTIGTIGKV